MKAMQVVARGRAILVDAPVPEIKPGHVLVKPEKLSLCGSDIFELHFAADDIYPLPPGTTGHEMVGVIDAIDVPETTLQVGDHVLALAPDHQAMAEYYLAPVEHVIPLPSGQPLQHLLQAQQLGTVLYACQRLPNLIGKTVAVIGQGSAGLWFNFQLRRMGAKRVIALDLEDFRLQLSKAFGATHSINNADRDPVDPIRQITGGELPDLVVEAAGEVSSINLAIDVARRDGDILYFGVPRAEAFTYNFAPLFRKCCRVCTIVDAWSEPNQESTRMAVDLIASGAIDVSQMITHHIPFADVLDAYELHRTRKDGAIKIVVEM